MAYTPNTLTKADIGFGIFANSYWWYDTLDVAATVEGAAYIADAQAKGMKPGDVIEMTVWTTAIPDPVTPADGVATPLTGSGSIAAVNRYRCRGLTAAGAAVLTNELTQTLVAA